MRSPSTEELQLWRGLVAEEDNLSALVQETDYAIGQVARNGYAGLHKLPARRESILDRVVRPTPLFNITPRTYHRDTVMPDLHVPVPGNDAYVVAETSTTTYTRVRPFRRMPFSLAGSWKSVTIQLHNPEEQPYMDPLFQIGTEGSASFYNQYRDTSPSKIIGNPRSPSYSTSAEKYYYASPENMRDDYAAGYSGALAVAGLVATSLEAAHDIKTDTSGISPLLEAWQNVAATDRSAISLRLVEFLPGDLAEQAGAQF